MTSARERLTLQLAEATQQARGEVERMLAVMSEGGPQHVMTWYAMKLAGAGVTGKLDVALDAYRVAGARWALEAVNNETPICDECGAYVVIARLLSELGDGLGAD